MERKLFQKREKSEDCRFYRDHLPAYADGEANGRADDIRSHLLYCGSCTKELAEYRALRLEYCRFFKKTLAAFVGTRNEVLREILSEHLQACDSCREEIRLYALRLCQSRVKSPSRTGGKPTAERANLSPRGRDSRQKKPAGESTIATLTGPEKLAFTSEVLEILKQSADLFTDNPKLNLSEVLDELQAKLQDAETSTAEAKKTEADSVTATETAKEKRQEALETARGAIRHAEAILGRKNEVVRKLRHLAATFNKPELRGKRKHKATSTPAQSNPSASSGQAPSEGSPETPSTDASQPQP